MYFYVDYENDNTAENDVGISADTARLFDSSRFYNINGNWEGSDDIIVRESNIGVPEESCTNPYDRNASSSSSSSSNINTNSNNISNYTTLKPKIINNDSRFN